METLKREGITKAKKGGHTQEPPEVIPEAVWIWRLFNILNRHRGYGANGPQTISIMDVNALSEMEELLPVERVWLLEVVGELDRLFLEDSHKKREEQKKKASRQGRGRTIRGKG